MKRFPLFLAMTAMVFFISCKGKEQAAAKMEPIASVNMNVVAIKHTVKDFDTWKAAYMAHDSVRNAHGLATLTMGRGMDDPNTVYIVHTMSDMQKAKDFLALPDLKAVMDSAGVTGEPEIIMANVIRLDTTMKDTKARMRMAHHVKDFDAWLKVYDEEGREMRMEYGLADRAISRGIDDPNMVHVTFYVTDMEKAKARGASPELKAIMDRAGVDSEPVVFMYTVVN
ncbi:MAG: hypothetical protein M3R25_01800 [Bacteroidota bacterium]|nr:hypothetical protein [Bacteroidota bacterium]